MSERADDAAPDPLEGLGVGVELVLELVLGRKLVGVMLVEGILVEERVVVVVVSEIIGGISLEDEDNEEVGGMSGEIVLVGERHVGAPEESRLHSYPPAGGKRS